MSPNSVQSELFLNRLTDWLKGTELFEQAWKTVCANALNWWWSEQLCLFTVGAWTVFLSAQGESSSCSLSQITDVRMYTGRRYNIRYTWAYMLLGQVVAISVASNLFYLAISLAPPPKSKKTGPSYAHPSLWISVLLSLVTVGITPFTNERTFLPNLLVMHVLILLPLLAPSRSTSFSLRIRTLYGITTLFAFLLHLRTIGSALALIPPSNRAFKNLVFIAWDVLHSHPAQSSIGWDVVWTTFSFLVWQVLGERKKSGKVPSLLFSTAVCSVGVSAADDWRKDEGWIDQRVAKDK